MELPLVDKKQTRLIRWNSLVLDVENHHFCVDETAIAASKAEFGLLHLLISRRNLPMTKDAIMAFLFGPGHGRDPRQVDMFVARLRQALSAHGLAGLIRTVGGRGYAVMDDDRDATLSVDAVPHGLETAALAG